MSTGADGPAIRDRAGERKTEALFVEHYDFMFAAACKVLKSESNAEDVIQNLYFKLVDSDLPPGVWADPRGYLYRTVVNACHDWRRARKSRKENQGVEKLQIAEPRSGHAHENAIHELQYLMGNLNDDIARIVMLHAETGLSDAEIAAMIGASRPKIAKILSRAREKLRNVRRGNIGQMAVKEAAAAKRKPDRAQSQTKRRTNCGLAGRSEAKEGAGSAGKENDAGT